MTKRISTQRRRGAENRCRWFWGVFGQDASCFGQCPHEATHYVYKAGVNVGQVCDSHCEPVEALGCFVVRIKPLKKGKK